MVKAMYGVLLTISGVRIFVKDREIYGESNVWGTAHD